jgi:UDP-GlcNAc:undecaprenyl-phosphate GlcNAc-1-phosphate transferase
MWIASLSASFILALCLTYFTRNLAKKYKILDHPGGRKLQTKAVPLWGGLAIFLAAALVLLWQNKFLVVGQLEYHHWWGVLIGALILVIGGALDDKYDLKPRQQIIFPILASLAVIAGGVGIAKITNPFSGLVYLDNWQVPLGYWFGQMHYFVVITDIFTFLWLMGMMYTTKLLDGLDGLASGVGAVASIMIFLFTMTTRYYQPDIALAAAVFAGACLGFLVWNWHPAKIYLGEGGSTLIGFILGVLSIISGGKIAVALLIMGIPIMDVVWAIVRRSLEGKNPFKNPDRQHLHFRLADSRLGVRKTVIIYYIFAVMFGLNALFLQSRGKLISLLILGLVMLGIIIWLARLDKKSKVA